MEYTEPGKNDLEAERMRIAKLLSHDFRSPLTQILGLVQIMKLDPSPERQAQYLEKVQHAADSLDGHLLNLRDYLRLEKRLKELQDVNKNQVQISKVVGQWISRYEHAIHAKELVLELSLNPEFIRRTHTDVLDDIIRHLIHNAVKFTPKKGQVLVTLNSSGCLLIENDYSILSPIEITRLTDPFYPSHSMGTASEPGIGLGLFLAAELSRAAGVQLSIDTKGKIFSITVEFQ